MSDYHFALVCAGFVQTCPMHPMHQAPRLGEQQADEREEERNPIAQHIETLSESITPDRPDIGKISVAGSHLTCL
jgi:hypothetical protein